MRYNRPPAEPTSVEQVQGAYGAEERSVHGVHERDNSLGNCFTSTGATQQLLAEGRLCKRSNRALFISLLLHGLAFAGTNWTVSVGNIKGKSVHLQPTVCMDVKWDTPLPASVPSSNLTVKGKEQSPPRTRNSVVKRDNKQHVPIASGSTETATDSSAVAVLVPYPDNPTPAYPEQARRQGLKGEMMFILTIDARGYVVKIDIEQGHNISPLLKEAAFAAIKKWRFIRQDKTAKLLTVTLPIVFNLET